MNTQSHIAQQDYQPAYITELRNLRGGRLTKINGITTSLAPFAVAVVTAFASTGAMAQYVAGTGATLNGSGGSTAVGNNAVTGTATAVSNNSVALGSDAKATGGDATALGTLATADNNSTSVGMQAKAEFKSVAVGRSALAYSRGTAIGNETSARADESTAIGTGSLGGVTGMNAASGSVLANTDARGGVAIGRSTLVTAAYGVGLGYQASVSALSATAIGQESAASGANSIAMGTLAKSDSSKDVAIGNDAITTNLATAAVGSYGAIAIGDASRSQNNRTIAIGSSATATGNIALALGVAAIASADNSIALGLDARSTSNGTVGAVNSIDGAISIGDSSRASDRGVALGKGANAGDASVIADTSRATAIGSLAIANAKSAVSLGAFATSKAEDGVAIGTGYEASGNSGVKNTAYRGVAIGALAVVSGNFGVATGVRANSSGADSIAFGTDTKSAGASAIAIGKGATASQTDSVALGSSSITAAATATAAGTFMAATGANNVAFAGTAPIATVSVGDSNKERTITNLAAGRLNATSTDAVNGSQLFGIMNVTDTKMDAQGTVLATALGGGAAYNSTTNTLTAPTYTLSNAGGTHNSVGAALGGINTALSNLSTTTNNANYALSLSSATNMPDTAGFTHGYFGIRGAGEGYNASTFLMPQNDAQAGSTAYGAMAFAGKGTNNTAIGSGAFAGLGRGNVAVGTLASVTDIFGGPAQNDESTAIGNDAKAWGSESVAVGSGSEARAVGAVALGRVAAARGDVSTAIGTGAEALASAATAVGAGAVVLGENSAALGVQARVAGTDALSGARLNGGLAMGNGSFVEHSDAVALGTSSRSAVNTSDAGNTVGAGGNAFLVEARSTGVGAISVGGIDPNTGIETYRQIKNVAPGFDLTDAVNVEQLEVVNNTANAAQTNAIAAQSAVVTLGRAALTTSSSTGAVFGQVGFVNAKIDNAGTVNNGATAYGESSSAQGNFSTAFGTGALAGRAAAGAVAAKNSATAVGYSADAGGANSVAVGYDADAIYSGSTALGSGSWSEKAFATSLGANARAKNAFDVALGAGSVTDVANQTSATTISVGGFELNKTGSTAFAGQAAASVVSVGIVGTERQITNVAAGRVSATSTDALNGSQLFSAVTAVDSKMDAQGAVIASALGGGSTYTATTNTLTAPTYSHTNANSITGLSGTSADVGSAVTRLDTALGTLNTTLTGGSSVNTPFKVDVVAGSSNDTIVLNSSASDVNKLDLNNAGAAITVTGVKNGAAANDAVNFSQLDAVKTTADNTASAVNNATTGLAATKAIADAAKTTADGIKTFLVGTGSYAAPAAGSFVANTNAGLDRTATILGTTYDPATGVMGTPSYTHSNANTIITAAGGAAIPTNTTTVQGAVTRIDDALGALSTSVANATTGAAGVFKYDSATTSIQVGAAGSAATSIDFGNRKVTGVNDGTASKDAVNFSQLTTAVNNAETAKDTLGTQTAALLGGTTAPGSVAASYNALTNAYTAPTFALANAGSTHNTVGGALEALDNKNAAQDLALTALSSGNSANTPFTIVGTEIKLSTSGMPATSMNLAGTGGAITLTGVKAGTAGLDAVNFTQLSATNSNVNALGSQIGGTFNAAGVYQPVTFTTGSGATAQTHSTVKDAIGGLNTNVTNLSQTVSSIAGPTVNGGSANSPFTTNGATISVGQSGSNAATLNLANSNTTNAGGTMVVTGVANGTVAQGSKDAVNGGQLYTLQQSITAATGTSSGQAAFVQAAPGGVLTINSAVNASSVNMANKTVNGVKAADLSATSTDAVNGSQLYQTNQNIATLTSSSNARLDGLDSSVNKLTDLVGSNAKKAAAGTAMAIASIQAISGAPEAGTAQLGVGFGHQDGQSGLAIGVNATSESGRMGFSASIGAGTAKAKPSFGAGIRWKF